MAEWVGACTKLMTRPAEALACFVFAVGKRQADDMSVPMLDPGRGKTKTGRLWAYGRDDGPAGRNQPRAVLFRYARSALGEPQEHLKSFTGTLQGDAYAGFGHLYGKRIREAACWAHARRAFFDGWGHG